VSEALREPARPAGPELLVLALWEEFCGWFLDYTNRWPKSLRFTLTQRLQIHALDVLEQLVVARYDARGRLPRLHDVNLVLERMRFLLRLGRERAGTPQRGFEHAVERIDACGRMLHGWRVTLRVRNGESA
jgi:hypothetical protein